MNTKYIAPYILRMYIWEVLKKNLNMTDSDYDIDGDGKGYIPIVPLGEEPELENFDKPYMVYGYAESPATNTRTAGNMMIIIYSNDFADMSQVANVIVKTFEDDFAVNEVNAYSSTIRGFVGLRFADVRATTLEGGNAEESAGGRLTATVNIRYEYFSEYDLNNSIAWFNPATQKYELRA